MDGKWVVEECDVLLSLLVVEDIVPGDGRDNPPWQDARTNHPKAETDGPPRGGGARERVPCLLLCLVVTLLAFGCEQAVTTSPAPVPAPPAPQPPSAPLNLRVSASGEDFVEWSWDPVAGATGYEVQFRFDGAFTDTDEIIDTAGQTGYRREGLAAGTSVFLRVRTYARTGDDRLESGWSTALPAMTLLPPPPDAPANLRVSATGADFIVWSWDPVVGVGGYEVQFRFDDAFTEADAVIPVDAGQTAYRAGSLPFATSGYLRVRAVVDAGGSRIESGWSTNVAGRTANPPSDRSWPKYGRFTDSQGRTITYGLHLREEWDPSRPRGVLVFFHGNNQGTQEELSRSRYLAHTTLFDLGMAVAYVGSPEGSGKLGPDRSVPPGALSQRIGPEHGTRHWYAQDQRVVHELIQSGFDNSLAVDHNRVVFMGGSQGTCFLAKFFERYAGVYGGGFHAWCGCFPGRLGMPPRATREWTPSYPWTPLSAARVRERFRVFVEATTGDSLHDDGLRMVDYYDGVLGLETRFDLSAPGGHCATGRTPRAEIWEWLAEGGARGPVPAGSTDDADGDGIPNALDDDDDNDGAWDVIDALPRDGREWLDTDGDGAGDYEDRDADGDGIDNAGDAFSLDPAEWVDRDGDGIGDNMDQDDDNDGLPDASDPRPLEGVRIAKLSFSPFEPYIGAAASRLSYATAFVHTGKPLTFRYPDAVGSQQSYQYIDLGDNGSRFQMMVDRIDRRDSCASSLLPEFCEDPPSGFAYFEHYLDRIHFDHNRNGDLTDDGPPLVLARNRGDGALPGVNAQLAVPYASGETFPYRINLWTREDLAAGVHYMAASSWMGYVQPSGTEPVLVGVMDLNLDGLFDSVGLEAPRSVNEVPDFACVDLNRNDVLEECSGQSSPPFRVKGGFKPGETLMLDGLRYRILVSSSGHEVELVRVR